MENRKVKVLLAGESVADALSVAEFVRNWGCEAHIATSLAEAQKAIAKHECDLVLSEVRLQDGSAYPLIAYLAGTPITLFFFQPVREGCWWLPALRRGRYCWGTPAMRPGEFVRVLSEVLREIAMNKAEERPSAATGTGVPESVVARPRPVAISVKKSAPDKIRSTAPAARLVKSA